MYGAKLTKAVTYIYSGNCQERKDPQKLKVASKVDCMPTVEHVGLDQKPFIARNMWYLMSTDHVAFMCCYDHVDKY